VPRILIFLERGRFEEMLKIRPDCIPCTLSSALRMARRASSDPEQHKQVVQIMTQRLAHISWNESPFELAFAIQEAVFKVTGVRDPYSEVKKESNRDALELYPKMKKLISNSKNPLETAAKLAAAGNSIDFGVYSEVDLDSVIVKAERLEFAIKDFDEFEKRVKGAEKLLYFLDNAGEIVFDKLLIETMLEFRGGRFREITLVPKEEPLLNDATIADVQEVGLNKLPSVVIKPIGSGRKRAPYPRSREVSDWIKEHDLVIFKGQGNLELFLDEPDTFFILVAKCPIIAEVLGIPRESLVLRYSPPSKT